MAWYALDNGLSCALVETELVGGECSYWACMPSKALLRPGEVLEAARRVPGTAPAVTGTLDVEKTLATRDRFSSNWDDQGQAMWLESIGCRLLRGYGRLAGERTVEVDTQDGSQLTLNARRAVVVATGSLPSTPPVEGLDEVETWDSRDATAAKQVPRRLLVLGGGAVGVEMAQAWRRLGAEEVTIVQLSDRLLAREEPFAGELVSQALEADGIRVLTDANAIKVARGSEADQVCLLLEDGTTLVGDELLVATGRRARTDDIGLEMVGLQPGDYLEVDDHLRVEGVEGGWLYAVGDVNGRVLFTHQGKYQARLVGDIIAGKDGEAWADHRAATRVAFTDPQVAAVGLTEQQAHDLGVAVKTVAVDLTSVAGGSLLGRNVHGRAQLVIDQDRHVIVGATFVGPGVGELLHAATIAIVTQAPLDLLWHAVPAFPTVSEVWLRLLEADRGL